MYHDDLIIFTDIIEGAINQYCMRKLQQKENFQLISGFNIALLLEIVLRQECTQQELAEIVESSREQLVYVNDLVKLYD